MPKPKDAERGAPLAKEKKKLDLIHERFRHADQQWTAIRKEAKEDMRHVAGDPWEPKEKLARLQAMRPVPANDELSQYENQVVNEVRANPRAIRFSPVGFGANDKTATFYADKTREIEYRSHAQQHYTRSFQNMVERSYGYVKLRSEYVTDRPAKPTDNWSAFNKRLVIDGVPDPDCIYPDPDFLDATGRDWQWLFEMETQGLDDFRRNFPNAEIQSFSPELVKYANGWISNSGRTRTLKIASYWEIEKKRDILNAFEVVNPDTGAVEIYEIFDDEVEIADKLKRFRAKLVDKREVDTPTVWQYRTNGVEILKKTEWPGRAIPYAAMYGKMIWLDLGNGPELVIQSMTRLARGPNMLLAYYLACEAEMIGMTPKVPYFIRKGSVDATNMKRIQRANHTPVAAIEIETKSLVDGTPIEDWPQRMPFEPPIQAIEIAKEACRRSIQAAMGLTPLPTSAQRRNEKSGVALRQIEESGQRGSYHFIDSYDMGICRIGELIEDLIPTVYDYAGETPVLDNQKRPTNVFINSKQLGTGAEAPKEALESVDGMHAVTIDTGPDFASERKASSDFVDAFVASPVFAALPPPMAMEILSLLIKLKNLGPIGEEIAEILHPDSEEEQTVPAAKLQEAVQTGQQVIQALQQQIQQLEQEKQARVVETEGKAEIARQQNESKELIAMRQIDAKMAEANLEANVELKKAKMDEAMEMLKLHVGNQNQAAEREAGIATKGAELEHATAMAERGHSESAAEGDKGRDAAASEAERSRHATSAENARNRQSADSNAAADRKVKITAATKKPAGKK